ncbi:DUF1636 family protein [Aliiroseovarius sp. KMU-50]|uniref:DUF1636 family protein n=1 Tax=Aliiroseovarius salicola TaxID=3009082 RepID=A0ABT4W1K1_9RHOB|nr:DUF1636 family protein [Aliiroseovarius sp. KMU-50]MDA5093633.1 DUF1636 family protein [Aliiroseovarius sp. KMU-50]
MNRTSDQTVGPTTSQGTPRATQHLLLCTTCPHKGIACQAGFAMMAQLQRSITDAGSSIQDEFEISGYVELGDCDRKCLLAYHATPNSTYLFGDVEEDEDIGALVAYADTNKAALNRGDHPSAPAPLLRAPGSVMAMGTGSALA